MPWAPLRALSFALWGQKKRASERPPRNSVTCPRRGFTSSQTFCSRLRQRGPVAVRRLRVPVVPTKEHAVPPVPRRVREPDPVRCQDHRTILGTQAAQASVRVFLVRGVPDDPDDPEAALPGDYDLRPGVGTGRNHRFPGAEVEGCLHISPERRVVGPGPIRSDGNHHEPPLQLGQYGCPVS